MKKQNWYVNQRKYHFIYKTTCKVNDKYYLGMHSTDDLSDGYLGSGNLIAKSIKKHGRENFSIEILEFLPDRASLKLREAELVNEEKLTDPLCMNLRLGGEGWESTEASRAATIGNRSEARTKNPLWLKKLSDHHRLLHKTGVHKSPDRTGMKLTDAHKQKIGNANAQYQAGSGNSQFGTMWIFNDAEFRSMKIQRGDHLPSGWKPGRRMFTKTALASERSSAAREGPTWSG